MYQVKTLYAAWRALLCRPNDQILRINGKDVTSADAASVTRMLNHSAGSVHLVSIESLPVLLTRFIM